jgi:hypothetical protein
MSNYTIGDMLIANGLLDDLKTTHSYHKSIFIPEWFSESYATFKAQVLDMCKKKKPFKATDTFKIQAGYPHEVSYDHKIKLISRGIKQDLYCTQNDKGIPKFDVQSFILFGEDSNSIVSFDSPKDSQYIKNVVIVDTESNNKFSFYYVISRRAQVISAWAEPKRNGKHILKAPFNKVKYNMFQQS